jgi:membrane-associated phospholipid phosphatase
MDSTSDRAAASVQSVRGRHRRPSGEPPPLPRPPWWHATAITLVVTVVLGLVIGALYAGQPPDGGTLNSLLGSGSGLGVSIAKVFAWFGTSTGIVALRLALGLVLLFFRRWRHLVVALGAFVLMDALWTLLRIQLPAPTGTVLVVPTGGTYWFPASGMASFAVTVGAMVASLAPAGGVRRRVGVAAVVLALLVAASRVFLGAAYPLAALYSILLGFCVAFVVFGLFAPDESFPVSYARGGNAAHLDLAGARTAAVVAAMRAQLGLAVAELKAFGNEGSGGSTPLLMTLEDGRRIFGKILATSHARADRWYRIGRTILYGRLEDETTFSSVRKLIEYEDYAIRVLDDEGFTVAHTYGIVELTPDREYLLATEFFEGAETLGHAEVDDQVIDDGIALVRRLWDVGLAHRDIKPANLLVVKGHLQVIDVSGLEIRPSSWRQAVDLANMLLVLALRTDPDRVYRRALTSFTPEEIGEAFAAAQGLAIPTELQRYLKEDPRDLVGRFKELATPYPPISIQRWSVRRAALALGALAGVVLGLVWTFTAFFGVLG